MINQQKRKALKLITGAGAGLGLAGVPLAGHAAVLAPGSASTAGPSLPPLQIERLAGKAVPGDTVILRNICGQMIQLSS